MRRASFRPEDLPEEKKLSDESTPVPNAGGEDRSPRTNTLAIKKNPNQIFPEKVSPGNLPWRDEIPPDGICPMKSSQRGNLRRKLVIPRKFFFPKKTRPRRSLLQPISL
jgi:hypothetical protein